MADRTYKGAERDAEETDDEHLQTDPQHKISVCGNDNLSLKRDHCDLLLDAIDAQLGQLQLQSSTHQMGSRENDHIVDARLGWCHSLSKDRGLGSTQSNDTPMSDLIHTPTERCSSEKSWESLLVNGETENRLNKQTKCKEEVESQTEQVIWRLERLLGDTCTEAGLAGQVQPPSDSICTEDFHRCFREEMVEPALFDMHQLDIEEDTEGTEVTDSDNCQSEQDGHVFHFERGGSALTEQNSKNTTSACYSKSDMPHQRKEPENVFSVQIPRRTDDNTSRWHILIASLDDSCTNYCSKDTTKQEESDPLAHRCTDRNIPNTRLSGNKVQCIKKETFRHGSSSGDNDEATDETSLWNRGCQAEWRDVEDTEKEVEILRQHNQALTTGSSKERNSIIVSVLEREEMERQLDDTKTELFAEQRRAREELESMQEKLEETCELLQRATEAEISLREKCACLEEKHKQRKGKLEAAETRVRELHIELAECNIRLGSLEKLLAQKELQLLDFQEQCEALHADKDELKVELQHLKASYYKTLKEAQEKAYRMMVNQEAEEENVCALKDETACLTQQIQSMQGSIQKKEEEAMQLRKSLEQQREAAKNREKQLHVESLEKVHNAINEERREREAERVEAVRVHCRILEEKHREGLEHMRSEMQREKSRAQAFREQVLKLETKVRGLESERCAQQREQESLLAAIYKSLKEDHQAQLHRLQKEMAQAVQLADEEAGRLRVVLEEKESSHNQITAELEQQLGAWARELGTECQHLYLLVEQCGAKQKALHLPLSPSVAEALTNLRTLREQLKLLISRLHQELESQKQTSQQLRKDKERELSIQRQQLRVERDQALGFLKEQLILEHVEELSRLSLLHMGGGRAETLHRQMKTKDLELRQVQKDTSQRRERTAACLDPIAEPLRKASDVQQERQKMPDGTEGKTSFSAKEARISFCSSSLCAVDSAASYSRSDTSSVKLLCYLQSRVKQLRVENQAYTCRATSNSEVTTITEGGDSAGIQSSIDPLSS